MNFAGIQKLTLLDYPGMMACTLFCRGCNFRCPFCHNASLTEKTSDTDSISEDELLAFLKKRFGLIDGVVITGGEPTLYRELPEFIRKLKDIGYKVKLDTNGTNPDMLSYLIGEKLIDYVAMDIKSSPLLYPDACGVDPDMERIERSKNVLLEGKIPYEFRTTVVLGIHTAENLRGAAEWIRGASAYYLQTYKDSGDIIAPEGLSSFTKKEMNELAEICREFVPNTTLRGV